MSKSIAYIVTGAGTAKNFLSGYLSDVRNRGWRVTLVCAPDETVEEFAQAEGVSYRGVPFARDPALFKDVISLFRLILLLRSLSPDAVVYATPKASLLGAIASWVTSVPVRVYEQWGLRLESVHGPFRRVLYSMEWLAMRMSTDVVANSRSLARRIESLGLMRPNTAITLGEGSSHGVDLGWFSVGNTIPSIDEETAIFLSKQDIFTIGFVGRLHPDKGVDVLLKAVAECVHRGILVRCVLIGANEGVANPVASGLEDSIHYVGRVADPQPYYRAMDALALMSKREGFPNVVLEAASMGVPAIVSDGTGAVDSVVDEVTGFIVPVGHHMLLADKIQYLASRPEVVDAMGQAARRRVAEKFSDTTVRGRHIDLVESRTKAWLDTN